MKTILKSLKPKTCANIMNLIQSILIIKDKKEAKAIQKLIDTNGYAEFYVYCSKNKNIKLVHSIGYYYIDIRKVGKLAENNLNGKVVLKFHCYKMEEIAYQRVFEQNPFHFLEEESGYGTKTINAALFKKATCLTDKELEDYLNTDEPNKRAYAIYISNPEIFDEPKDLLEFEKAGSYNNPTIKCKKREQGRCNYGKSEFTGKWVGCEKARLTKAPQNFCYVDELI